MEDVGKRIKLMIERKNITNSQLADNIDLPRSILSHILSGRNKASLAVIQKIIMGYPDINPKWLLLGAGEMLVAPSSSVQEDDIILDEKILPKNIEEKVVNKNTVPSVHLNSLELESIVHYFKDGSFKVFLPKSH